MLTVTSATGGIWRFPLVVKSTECPPDDTITIESVGLRKPASVAFTLFSHSRYEYHFLKMTPSKEDILFQLSFSSLSLHISKFANKETQY